MSRKISRGLAAAPTDVKSFTSDQQAQLGAVIKDGSDEFVYVKAGASPLVAGTLKQGPAIVANHQNISVASAASAGATSVTVTLGATAATANFYAGGYMIVNDVDGQGHTYQIASNPAANSAASMVVTLNEELEEALTTSSQVCLIPNKYNGVIINPTTATNVPVGVGISDIPAEYYGWLQKRGPVACLNDGGTAVGLGLAPSGSVAGALATVAATTDQVAKALQAGVDTEYRAVDIRL
jgi:hypothetical protein